MADISCAHDYNLKRKKRLIDRCSNPLFAKWLQEWRDEAEERGHKSSYTYNKALNALKKYPLPLRSGQEAKVLENIGDKTAKMLDKKLSEHLSNGGSMEDLYSHHHTTKVVPAVNPRKCSDNMMTQPSIKHKRVTDDCSSIEAGPKKRRCSVSAKEYVPAHRSGPYAILMALLKAEQDPNFKGYLFKQDLITCAQPLCDNSFTIPDAGSYYTAWSSVGSMIKKNLLVKSSHPPKYSLTEEGVSLALRIMEAEKINSTQPSPPHSSTSLSQPSPHSSTNLRRPSPSHSSTSLRQLSPPHSITSLRRPYPPHSSTSLRRLSPPYSSTNLRQPSPPYSSINLLSPPHSSARSSANSSLIRQPSCTVTNTVSPNYSSSLTADDVNMNYDDDSDVICIAETTSSSNEYKKVKNSRCDSKQSSHINSISDDNNDEVCIIDVNEDDQLLPSVGHLLKTSRKLSTDSSTVNSSIHVKTPPCVPSSMIDMISVIDDSDDDDVIEPLSKRIGLLTQTDRTTNAPSICTTSSTTSLYQRDSLMSINRNAPVSATTNMKNDVVSHESSQDDCLISPLSSAVGSMTSKESPTDESLDSLLCNPLVTLKPGQFKVVLCIDNTESSANRKSTSQFRGLLLEELNKNGVQYSVRKLNIGDFLWIAKQTDQDSSSQDTLRVANGQEIVLEHIIERKRMDDLAGSIIDKRFGEQKFRMKNCGVYNTIYLIEEHGDSSHFKLPASSLSQAITNTQVVDEFFIKEAKDIRDSIAYLTIMTRMIESSYSGLTINGYSVDTMTMINKKRREMADNVIQSTNTAVSGIPFTMFNTSSIKNKASTVSDMFGRHLIQIPNSSGDKAAAILELYPTPSHLRKAYEKCCNQKERESLLTSLRTGECKRRFGPTLSALIHNIYWKKSNK